ncbi:kinase D-interacting substrate of 220 kDa B isoform X5 [Coccinella septempunctata]|uniref:kinase D-interacting substrate of 220 kDa B isoform X5 n=1 Tax=Coccinella septempunctata TaxID=41139 RepID=UPI001D09937D|nr:kinase D-interacting substrate of 220 kDa B isoform X5 [Coccinella septempunctata]
MVRKRRFGTYTYTLQRSESMLSLCFRSLETYINDDNLDGLRAFLENKQVQIEDRDDNGTTALIYAAQKGRLNFVQELLKYGADPNAEDNDNWTPLLCACKEGYFDIVLLLLENNADIEHRDMGGWTPLMWATYKGRTEIVQILLERGAEVNAHGNYHISSLLWAAGRGHTRICRMLIDKGAKVNVGDKYGTTALIWASRKGHLEIVDMLLRAGANVDTAGMYSWTPLIVATQGNFIDVVNSLLEFKPNINALDKDGCSALTLACKEGYYEIATALLAAGAYINIQDRSGDTNLIHAVKGGHRGVVEALLKKYADVDIAGKDKKSAIYIAVEKGNINIVKLLLNSNPDLEIETKDGDTPLLKAVRSRNAEIVQLLLDKKAKVSAADKRGDTALHIAMRSRSKTIVEILLRNPKHSQLLYRPNKAGETPYNIDGSHQKTILGQIFGARRLNTNEDNENMLGYDLYTSSLADMLSEPSLSMPITVGLYAKWGSGKSFLLNKLRAEMKSFAKEWSDPVFQFSTSLFLVLLHFALVIGTIIGLGTRSWVAGVILCILFLVVVYICLFFMWFANKSYDISWINNFNGKLAKKINNVRLVFQILFCHPPNPSPQYLTSANPIRFYFTDLTRVSSTTGGENSVVQMIGSLYDAIENDYGPIATRLYRAFKPKPGKTSSWKWRKMCCLPYIVLFEITFLCILVGISALTVYFIHLRTRDTESDDTLKLILEIVLITAGSLLGLAAVANLYTFGRMCSSLMFSQRRHLQRTIAKIETLKSEGFLQAVRQEVNLMKEMIKCIDGLSQQQSRLVVIMDGLDSCEQEKVLLILDTVHMLFSDASSPFIVILAIDPHVIAKAVEMNTRRLFSESNIGGHSYLNNMVHLPFFLQNSGLRKVKVAQQVAASHKKPANSLWSENEENLNSFLARSASSRRLSSESALMSSQEKLKHNRKGSRKLKLSESIASSIGSNLNRIGGPHDLTKMLLTDDYFSDVNPRSMRRLFNVVYVTGRLLKSFKIDFNWYRLASWINITEQWPFRTSWILYHVEMYEDSLEESTPLKVIYEKIKPQVQAIRDNEPLLELDRDEKKLEIFLSYHKTSLLISDIKIFVPFTINLDPYLKKVIKEELQNIDEEYLMMSPPKMGMLQNNPVSVLNPWNLHAADWTPPKNVVNRRTRNNTRFPSPTPSTYYPQASNVIGWAQPWISTPPQAPPILPPPPIVPAEILDGKLSSLNVDGVCKLLHSIEDLSKEAVSNYTKIIKDHNINGRVLTSCDLDELKQLLQMTFGDWEMFKATVFSLREMEFNLVMRQEELKLGRPNKDRKGSMSKSSNTSDKEPKIPMEGPLPRKQSVMEKQVTLEDQMICGALQTLNEEACEDVLEETEDARMVNDQDLPVTSIIPPSPDTNQDYETEYRSRTNSTSGYGETDFVMLQPSPIGHWQPVSICIQGNSESLSESSRCSSQLPSPVLERRNSNTIQLGKLKNQNQLDDPFKKGKHVVINIDPQDSTKVNISTAHNTVSYNIKEVKPLLQQEKKTTASQTRNRPRPNSLSIAGNESKSRSVRNRSKSIDHTAKQKNNEMLPSLDALNKIKEKLLHSSPELHEGIGALSDNESTPLVSELSASPKSGHSSDVRSSDSNGYHSPISPHSLSPDYMTSVKENSIIFSSDSTPTPNSSNANLSPSNGDFGKKKKNVRSRRHSDSCSLSLSKSTGSNNSIQSSSSSRQLSRQSALEESFEDIPCDLDKIC